jgi:hypothetical protein
MKRTQIQLHSEQLKWLKKEALEQGVSMAELIRESVNAYRSKIEKNRQMDKQKEVALGVVGLFSIKKPD